MKKFVSVLLSVLMLVSVFTVSAGATEEKNYPDNAYVALDNLSEEETIDIFSDNEVKYSDTEISFDPESATLTLNDIKKSGFSLSTSDLDRELTIEVKGECELDRLSFFGMSVNISGSGKLTVNADKSFENGIVFYGEESFMKLNFDDTVSAEIYGSESAVLVNNTTVENAITVGSKALDNVSAEKFSYSENEEIFAVNPKTSRRYGAYMVTKNDDPEGIYCAQEISRFVEDPDSPYDEMMGKNGYWKALIEITKYIYNEGYDAVYRDNRFESVEFPKDELEKNGYAYIMSEVTVPETQKFYKPDDPLETDTYYEAYLFNNPEKPNEMWGTGSYIYEDRTSPVWKYNLSKFEYSEKYKNYVIAETNSYNVDELTELGYSFMYDENGKPVEMHYYNIEEDNEFYITYRMTNENDPEGIYGLNTYPYPGEDDTYSCCKLVYNEEHNRYEEVEDAKFYVSVSEFVEKGYEYILKEVPRDFDYPVLDFKSLGVYTDEDGKKYAVDWLYDIVYNYSENDTFTLEGCQETFHVIEKNSTVDLSDLKPLEKTIVIDNMFIVKYDGQQLSLEGKSEPTTEPPTTAEPTTEAPTAQPTTEAPTVQPATEAPTAQPTTEAPTVQPTTEAPTVQPTTEAPTVQPTTAAPAKIDLSNYKIKVANMTYSGNPRTPKVKVYSPDGNKISPSNYTVTYKNNKNAGTGVAVIKGTGNYTGQVKEKFKITKAKQPLKATPVNKTFRYSDVKRRAINYKAIKVSSAKGRVTLKKQKGTGLVFNSRTRKIEIKKGTKQGTYIYKIIVKAAGNKNYEKGSKTVEIKVIIK